MDIFYKKNTLYVNFRDEIDSTLIGRMEHKVDNIMSTYSIDNLVIDTNSSDKSYFRDFETKYNRVHSSKVIIK